MARANDQALIDKVKKTWRAQDGETVEEIIGKASKVAHFVPRGWEVGKVGNTDAVIFSWAKHRADKPSDEYSISWTLGAEGAMALQEPYAKPMELGWRAFAISLIASEVNDEDKAPNLRFLHDVSNFEFVTTGQGKLSDLLKRGQCTLGTPVTVDYLPKLEGADSDEKGDFWLVELNVNCDIAGPKYFTRNGAISFKKYGQGNWKPVSFFAQRIDTYAPGSWFDHIESKEQETWEIGRKALGLPAAPSPFPK